MVSKCLEMLSKLGVRLGVRGGSLHVEQLCFEKLCSDRVKQTGVIVDFTHNFRIVDAGLGFPL